MFPRYWSQFIADHNLAQKEISIADKFDLSGVGIEMCFLTEEQSIDELTNFWPGIGVKDDGFIPVGECSISSGDYYYINVHDGKSGPLYRIYHDEVDEHGYDRETAIATVLPSYENILEFANT